MTGGVEKKIGANVNWSLLAATRFFLALVVAGGHLGWFSQGLLSKACESLSPKAAVLGFLLISGFSIAASMEREPDSFYFRRFKRVYPLYLVCVLAAIGLEFWIGDLQLPFHKLDAQGILTAIGNVFMLQLTIVKPISFDGVVWTLAIECAFYAAAPFLRRVRLVWLLGMIAVSLAIFLLPEGRSWGAVYEVLLKLNHIKYFWPFGMGLIFFYQRSILLRSILSGLGIAVACLSKISGAELAGVTMGVSFIVVAYAQRSIMRSKILNYFGDLSYPLYLVHLPTYCALYAFLGVTSQSVLLFTALVVAAIALELIDVRLKQVVFLESHQLRSVASVG